MKVKHQGANAGIADDDVAPDVLADLAAAVVQAAWKEDRPWFTRDRPVATFWLEAAGCNPDQFFKMLSQHQEASA